MEIYILDKLYNHNEQFPVDIYDLNCLIERVDDLILCPGGPEFCGVENLNIKNAYKDCINKWRHNLCTLVIHDCKVCVNCDRLEKGFILFNQEINNINKIKTHNLSNLKKRKILQN